jgi:hypothetical protein
MEQAKLATDFVDLCCWGWAPVRILLPAFALTNLITVIDFCWSIWPLVFALLSALHRRVHH